MQQNRGQMPTRLVKPEGRVIYPKPKKKQRAIVIPGKQRGHLLPHRADKILRNVAPSLNKRIEDNLVHVIVGEHKLQRTKVSDGGDEKNDAEKIPLAQD